MDPDIEQLNLRNDAFKSLCERAKQSRREGIAYVVAIVGIAFAVVFYFVYAANSAGINISVVGNADLINVSADHAEWVSLISGLVLRLGAVILAVFLIQIMVSLARYRFRISDSLYTKAEAVRLSNGNIDSLKILLNAFSDVNIDFGSLPESPYIEFVKVLRDIASKSTGK